METECELRRGGPDLYFADGHLFVILIAFYSIFFEKSRGRNHFCRLEYISQ